MKILLIATRHPHGRQSGRKSVLRTIINSCRSLGHEVRVVAITTETVAGDIGEQIETVRPPGLLQVLANVVSKASRGLLSLNECLYAGPRVQRAIDHICDAWEPDIVIADMIRTAPIALATGRPTHVDLDDLLSARYRNLSATGADADTILGYYGSFLPRVLRTALARIAARLIGIEAELVARRERTVAHEAHSISLVAQREATTFGHQVHRMVAWLPMAVTIPPEGANVASNAEDALVFVGGLDYHANLEAVRTYVQDVVPALDGLGIETVPLRVIGYCPDAVRLELGSSPGIVLLDYVDDLTAELAEARAFVAPIQPGTGIKTKVLEAMAAGLPVISTSHGVQGFPAVDGEHCIIANDGPEMARAIEQLRREPALASKIGSAGRALVTDLFAPEVVAARWRVVLERLAGMPPPAP